MSKDRLGYRACSQQNVVIPEAQNRKSAIGEIGKDLDATEKEEAQPMAVAVVSSQIASITAAAASAARGGSTPSGGNLGGGGGGGTDAPKTRKTSSRKELK